MEDLSFPAETFDIVFSSLAFHYVRDFDALSQNIRAWLKPGGTLHFFCRASGLYRLRIPGLVL